MYEWRSGDLFAMGAGAAVLVAAFAPWVEGGSGSATQLWTVDRGLFAVAVCMGVALAIFGYRRSSWTGLVALTSALVMAFVLFTAALPAHAGTAHPGFGLFAGGAAGIAAVVAGVLNAIEREGDTF